MDSKLAMFGPSVLMATLLGLGCGSSAIGPAEEPQDAASLSELYVFNISGPTLIPSPLTVTDNGRSFLSVSRNRYKVVDIPAGEHELAFEYRRRPSIRMEVVAGETYYVVIGYRPERSWLFPLAGGALVIRQLDREAAAPLLERLRRQ